MVYGSTCCRVFISRGHNSNLIFALVKEHNKIFVNYGVGLFSSLKKKNRCLTQGLEYIVYGSTCCRVSSSGVD